ncbi:MULTISPECIES: CmpA/NrtA family ABC transporter substrate-binding protein [unclassified Coleofasciculus]|uniref:CmpA/NrtA family ABC transporter substrate-binding protein n=1 Tax=unclassified Coleofasciculus TaxID=2692782 RepID=UPI00187FD88D|nr:MULTISPECIES: CmpA/NrtA family ABC transporter substrate-binding protein [unclassified Coleofasciculus]MBE9129293.1 ABC transporter substrate-binding protein [Coleofasciculus sp. LEGE 07081]MBE9151923.1 ABC transporter substrate-binding protein [Coleofasciculus sp. LEGE 07092]
MKRRKFLKYGSLAGSGLVLAACSQLGMNSQRSDRSSESSQQAGLDFGKLEKSNLSLGFIPTTDCTPLVIAQELGFFAKYGLDVTLTKESDWQGIQDGLLEWRFDAAHALAGMPILAQLGSAEAPMVPLMVLNLNGSGITLSQKAWDANIRPSTEYFQFQEFADAYRQYIRRFEEPPTFATEFSTSMDNYISRYWLSAMGINPETEVEFSEIPPSQMIYKIQAGVMDGYGVSEPWNQLAVAEKAGFTAYVNQTIWKGHPGSILATMQPWIKENPTTARALVAAVLEACRYCDEAENRQEIAQILSQSRYLDTDTSSIQAPLLGTYNYGGFDQKERVEKIPDFYLFHFRSTDYLERPDHVNYPWRSHGVWLLTQMIRWNQLDMSDYPKYGDKIFDRLYPREIYDVYKDVAQSLNMELPSEQMKVEPAAVFIDQREFDPSTPVAYLNSFDIWANAPRIFAV